MTKPKAGIIGSGIGGLAAAIRLAVRGYSVEVFEKNSGPGGKLGLLVQDGFRFDTGPSLFTQPELIEELFELAGEPVSGYFRYRPVDLACRYFFPNGKRVNAFSDAAEFAAELSRVTGEPAESVIRYLAESARVYNKTGSIFLNQSLHKTSTWLSRKVLAALMATGREHLFSTLDQFNKKRFRSPEAIQIFNRFATYNGSNPYQAPGMLSLIPHLEFNEGVYYPEGGMYSITEALYQLALKTGVRFHFHSPVRKILVSGTRVKGLAVCGENKEYDIVISNLDVYFTYRDLLHRPVDAERVLRSERSSSALIFYWGINRTFPDLDLHNIFFSEDYPAEFDHLFRLKSPYEDPTVYINITAKMEAGHAPAGKENWFVMVNAPAVQVPDQQAQIQTARHCILEKLSRMLGIPVADHLETEAVLTPGLIESRTGSYLGSLYGTSSNSPWAAFLRHPNFSRRISGLYFAGGSVHPGGGIPLCLRSARIVSGQVPNPQPH